MAAIYMSFVAHQKFRTLSEVVAETQNCLLVKPKLLRQRPVEFRLIAAEWTSSLADDCKSPGSNFSKSFWGLRGVAHVLTAWLSRSRLPITPRSRWSLGSLLTEKEDSSKAVCLMNSTRARSVMPCTLVYSPSATVI